MTSLVTHIIRYNQQRYARYIRISVKLRSRFAVCLRKYYFSSFHISLVLFLRFIVHRVSQQERSMMIKFSWVRKSFCERICDWKLSFRKHVSLRKHVSASIYKVLMFSNRRHWTVFGTYYHPLQYRLFLLGLRVCWNNVLSSRRVEFFFNFYIFEIKFAKFMYILKLIYEFLLVQKLLCRTVFLDVIFEG